MLPVLATRRRLLGLLGLVALYWNGRNRVIGLLMFVPVAFLKSLVRCFVSNPTTRPRSWSVVQDFVVMLLRYAMNRLPYQEVRRLCRIAMPVLALPFDKPRPVPSEQFEGIWIGDAESTTCCIVLYTHGGGYACGQADMWMAPLHHLIKRCGALGMPLKVLSVEYSLAPESRYPTPVLETLHAYQWLLAQGIDPRRIVFAGDSAGGGIALGATIAVRDAHLPLPAGQLLFSPWCDLSCTSPVDPADYLHRSTGQLWASMYLQGQPLDNAPLASHLLLPLPLVSNTVGKNNEEDVGGGVGEGEKQRQALLCDIPLEGRLLGLPPMCVVWGGREILKQDSLRLCEAAEASGVRVTRVTDSDQVHVYPMLLVAVGAPAVRALDNCGDYLVAVCGDVVRATSSASS